MKLRATRIRLNRGGYAPGKYGQYFGQGAPLYLVTSEDNGDSEYVRAGDAKTAKLAALPELARREALALRAEREGCNR